MATNDPGNTNGTNLATLNADGSAPESRIPTAWQAQRVYQRLWDGYNLGRGRINAKVQGAINGNTPVPQSKLDAEGLGWMSNLNFRLLEGDVNSAQIPLYMLFADVPQYAQITTEMPKVPDEVNTRIGQIIGEEHTQTCNEWRWFDYNFQLSIANMCKFGSGPLYFPAKEDWRFKAANQGCVFVPDETTQNLDELPVLYIYYEWELTDLYRAIMQPKAAEAGWDVPAVKQQLILACNEFSGFTRARSWEYWEQKLREEDVYWSQVVPRIRTTWGYVKEFSGKISRFLIVANNAAEGQGEFLFRKDNEYDNWDQIIHPFFCEIGNGNWNGVKGIGIKAYNFRDAQNKLKNRVLDAAFLGSQILLQASDAKAAEDLQLVQIGPMAIIPPGVTAQQMPILSTLDKPMAVDRALEVDLQRNIGGIRQNVVDAQTNQPISATEAQINATYTNQITQAQQTLWLRQLDCLYSEQVKRLAVKPRMATTKYPHTDWEEMAAKFHKRCADRGVPPEAFKHIRLVRATRSIGRGSEYFKQQLGMQVYTVMQNDPNVPQGVVTQHLRNVIANLTGREYLDMIWPESQLANAPTEDVSKAQDENGIMLNGVAPVWTPSQNNLAHATTHLQFMGQQMQATQQSGQQPGAGQGQQLGPAVPGFLKTAQVAIPHIQQTLQALQSQGGNNKQFQGLYNMLQQLVSQTTQMGQQWQQQQMAAAQAQQEQMLKDQQAKAQAQQMGQLTDPDSIVKMAKVHADAQIKGVATQADIQRKNLVAAADIHRNATTTGQQLGINDLKAAKQIGSKKNGQA